LKPTRRLLNETGRIKNSDGIETLTDLDRQQTI